jgi:hypothetical protein
VPKLWLEVRLTGSFRAVDDEREFTRAMIGRLERLVEKYLEDNDLTQIVRLEQVVADMVEPDDTKDRIRKRGKRDTR